MLKLQARVSKHRRTASLSYLQTLSDARAICAALTNRVDRMPAPDRKVLRLQLRDLIARTFERIEFDPVEERVSLGYISVPVVALATPPIRF